VHRDETPRDSSIPPMVPAAGETSENAEPPKTLMLLGGRFWVAMALLVATGIGMNGGVNAFLEQLTAPRSKPQAAKPWTIGGEALVPITLITPDAIQLACADDEAPAGLHCKYQSNRKPWPKDDGELQNDNDVRLIQPYSEAGTNQLIFIAGLWNEWELAMRLHREPPETKKPLRFVAYCRLKFVGQLTDAAVRWNTSSAWGKPQSAMVAQPVTCTLTPPEGQ
jgi:hypothetical protein